MKGKFSASVTGGETVSSTRVRDQKETELCWDYAAASSIRKSLRLIIGK